MENLLRYKNKLGIGEKHHHTDSRLGVSKHLDETKVVRKINSMLWMEN